MIRRSRKSPIALALALAALVLPAAAQAAPGPGWATAEMFAAPTNLAPSGSGFAFADKIDITVMNAGGAPTSGPITLSGTLPAGLTATKVQALISSKGGIFLQPYPEATCTTATPIFTCTFSEGSARPGDTVQLQVNVSPEAGLVEGTPLSSKLTITGGDAPDLHAQLQTTVSSELAPFDFLPGSNGLSGALTGADGLPATVAGSHPESLTVNLGFTSTPGTLKTPYVTSAEGGVRDAHAILPPGVVVNPNATPVRCTEAQLESADYGTNCPAASQIGQLDVVTNFLANPLIADAPLFNMVTPHGAAATFGFDPVGFGIFQHLTGGVHAGDYTLTAGTDDIVNLWKFPVLEVRTEIWGDPSSSIHNFGRGACFNNTGPPSCPVTPRSTPAISAPTSCQESLDFGAEADSWGNPGAFHQASAEFIDSLGNPTSITDCAALGAGFQPTLKARPTTNLADSPSGLEVDLKIPQTNDLKTLATAHLRKAVVALPEGLVINPSSANGLAGCSSAQIGIDPNTGVANGNEPSCPDASRIGSVEVDTVLVDHPLPGSVYVAAPHDNPFDSLLAIYIVFDDAQSGTLVKLAGHVVPDPNTGRLITTFDENPQLPFEDFKLSFFGGAGGVLRTPTTCGEYSTTSEMTPWSAPDSGPPATPHDDYAITQGPGGSCATNESALPNSPSFDAGSASPIAAADSSFVLHLRRNDGSQRFSAVNVSPPPGLTAKLAGTEPCSDAALAAAAQKSGREEQQSPSCPASSQIGALSAAAGAGPAPYTASGKVYLSGPYKGAPLSLAFLVPAVAGPYDLGTVVTKAAVRLDPATGRVTTVSDPLPTILGGIPLDVRSVDVSLDRPHFTRNGTSCDPLSVDGSLTSTLGQVASLKSRFQLAECTRLAFKPKLSIRLLGGTKRRGHPALRATLQMPAGGANIAKASVALPRSEFLDQAHIGTVCTRVQFAEGPGNGAGCPAASIYGHATATSPLVPYTLEGNAYLRSSSHELPDLVAALHGPPSQPIAIEAVGRVDSVKGGIRTTFEGVPDLPVSSFVLSLAGAKKGLLQNSTDICRGKHEVTALFDAQNGKIADLSPELKNGKCRKAKKKAKGHRKGHGHRAASRHRAAG